MCEGNLIQALPYRRSGAKGGGKSPIQGKQPRRGGGWMPAGFGRAGARFFPTQRKIKI
jgi:hypothetical protein